MKEPFEFKILRRGAAAALPGKPGLDQETRGLTNPVAEEVRSQAMGHVNGPIYEKSYRNQVVDGSVAAAKRKAQDDPTVQVKLDENTRLRKDNDRLSKRKLTSLFKASREEYFSTLGYRRLGPPRAMVIFPPRRLTHNLRSLLYLQGVTATLRGWLLRSGVPAIILLCSAWSAASPAASAPMLATEPGLQHPPFL
jgi:hypothetical protein